MISSGMTEVWTHQGGSSSVGCTQSGGSQCVLEMFRDTLTLCSL